jgi:hypothetical protein
VAKELLPDAFSTRIAPAPAGVGRLPASKRTELDLSSALSPRSIGRFGAGSVGLRYRNNLGVFGLLFWFRQISPRPAHGHFRVQRVVERDSSSGTATCSASRVDTFLRLATTRNRETSNESAGREEMVGLRLSDPANAD